MNETILKQAEFLKNPSGAIIMDGKEVAHTRQCCHGGEHFISIRGSGKRRGFCMNCKKITCGKPECDVCIPYDEKLDLMEGKSLKKSKYAEQVQQIQPLFVATDGTKLL